MLYESKLCTSVVCKSQTRVNSVMVSLQQYNVFPHLYLGSSLPPSSAYSYSTGEAASNNFSNSVVSDMFSGDNCSQHDG